MTWESLSETLSSQSEQNLMGMWQYIRAIFRKLIVFFHLSLRA